MRFLWLTFLAAAVVSAGCTTDQIGGLAAGYNQARAASKQQGPTHTTCTKIGDDWFCTSQ